MVSYHQARFLALAVNEKFNEHLSSGHGDKFTSLAIIINDMEMLSLGKRKRIVAITLTTVNVKNVNKNTLIYINHTAQ